MVIQKDQFDIIDDNDFCLNFSKKIIKAKIHNQRIFLYRLNYSIKIAAVDKIIEALEIEKNNCDKAEAIDELMGTEGIASKCYFEGLRYFIPEQYKFETRSKNPPTDPVSSVLSFLYSLLFNDILLAIQNSGLHPYASVMHKIRQGHPALASDLMEEFRASVSDSIAMDFLTNYLPKLSDFSYENSGEVYVGKKSAKKLIELYETKMHSEISYIKKEGMASDYRTAFYIQVQNFCEAVQNKNPGMYHPVEIR